MFKTIEKEGNSLIIDKKSKFIGQAFPVESVNEAEEIIGTIKKRYHDARHHCYAYRILEQNAITEKQSDDGEPSRNSR